MLIGISNKSENIVKGLTKLDECYSLIVDANQIELTIESAMILALQDRLKQMLQSNVGQSLELCSSNSEVINL